MREVSSVPKRQLGRELRHARIQAGMGAGAAAEVIGSSRGRLYRIEDGTSPAKVIEVRALGEAYGCKAELIKALEALAVEAKSKGWWHSYGDVIPSWFELFIGLEQAATHLRIWEPSLVPGLLQVPEYAEEIIRLDRHIDDAEVARRVDVRMARQALLSDDDRMVDVIVDESVLRRSIKDVDGMARQLLRLASEGARVLPTSLGLHPACVAGAFVILDFPGSEPRTVYQESLSGSLYLDKDWEVAQFAAAWAELDGLALSRKDSEWMITDIVKEMGGDGSL